MKYLAICLALAIVLGATSVQSQTFTTLAEFTGSGGTASGSGPYGSLTLVGSNLYGMTLGGGAYLDGNVFSVGTNGANYQNLVSFTGSGGTAAGELPYGSLTLVGSALYGMTDESGFNGFFGNVFSVGTNGTSYQNIISFTSTIGPANGDDPRGSLTLVGTALYGMTYSGGNFEFNGNGFGNIFSVGSNGTGFQNLVSFTGASGTASGMFPYGNVSLVGSRLYGMTCAGGDSGIGNIFSVGTNGTSYQNLVSFTGTGGTAVGERPTGSLTLVGTKFYGMTEQGGAGGFGNVFSVGTDGTGYRNLISFTGSGGAASGEYPRENLILIGTALYGVTSSGGTNGNGNIFSVGLDGSGYQDLYDFTGGADGGYPPGDLLLSSGTLFGMALDGGIAGNGTVFAYKLPATTPEPHTLALAASTAAALVAYGWRRRQRAPKRRRLIQRRATPW